MQRLIPWLILIAVIAAMELAVRFALPFDLSRVLIVEALLFFGAGLASFALIARSTPVTGWRNGLQWTLCAAFMLAAVRATLWVLGVPVARANLTIAALAGAILTTVWVRRRRRRV